MLYFNCKLNGEFMNNLPCSIKLKRLYKRYLTLGFVPVLKNDADYNVLIDYFYLQSDIAGYKKLNDAIIFNNNMVHTLKHDYLSNDNVMRTFVNVLRYNHNFRVFKKDKKLGIKRYSKAEMQKYLSEQKKIEL